MHQLKDLLASINNKQPLQNKVALVHQHLKSHLGFIDHVAVTIYEAKTDLLKTFVQSSEGESPLSVYSSKLSDSSSLLNISQQRTPRLVNDLIIFNDGTATHTQRIAAHQYK